MACAHPQRTAEGRRLFAEFAAFYRAHRCRSAPDNPRRLFNLAFRCLYPEHKGRLLPGEFLSDVYLTLGAKEGEPRGLFQTFDPALYNGGRPVQDHFLNFFKRKLWGATLNAREAERKRGGIHRRVARPEAYEWGPAAQRGLLLALRAEVARLPARQRLVIRLVYREGRSFRAIGRLLGLDHKTVGKAHGEAVGRLRERLASEKMAVA